MLSDIPNVREQLLVEYVPGETENGKLICHGYCQPCDDLELKSACQQRESSPYLARIAELLFHISHQRR